MVDAHVMGNLGNQQSMYSSYGDLSGLSSPLPTYRGLYTTEYLRTTVACRQSSLATKARRLSRFSSPPCACVRLYSPQHRRSSTSLWRIKTELAPSRSRGSLYPSSRLELLRSTTHPRTFPIHLSFRQLTIAPAVPWLPTARAINWTMH